MNIAQNKRSTSVPLVFIVTSELSDCRHADTGTFLVRVYTTGKAQRERKDGNPVHKDETNYAKPTCTRKKCLQPGGEIEESTVSRFKQRLYHTDQRVKSRPARQDIRLSCAISQRIMESLSLEKICEIIESNH